MSIGDQWTGDFYFCFGESVTRNWDDARRFRFVSGGGGVWYSRTLDLLRPGDRILVLIPKRGYVGVGEVAGERVEAADMRVEVTGDRVPLLKAPGLRGRYMPGPAGDKERAEYVLPVKWMASVPRDRAYWEHGFFANRNTVCKLRHRLTRDRVLAHFDVPA